MADDSNLVLTLGIISAVIEFVIMVLVFVYLYYLETITEYKSILIFVNRFGVVASLDDVVKYVDLDAVTPDEALDLIGSERYHMINSHGKPYGWRHWRAEDPRLGHINQWMGHTTASADNIPVGNLDSPASYTSTSRSDMEYHHDADPSGSDSD
jgi:hypothetical protein